MLLYDRLIELRDGDILLRSWAAADVPAITAACQDTEIARWIPLVPVPYTEDDARGYLESCRERTEAGNAYPLAIVDAERGSLLGSIDMTVNSMGTGHVGYWIVKEARGRGVCSRALRLLARHGFDELGLGRVELVTDPDNRASQRVAQKAGFQREGILRSHLRHRDGTRRDSVMFSLLPGDPSDVGP